ncbi:restriction endonuclease subunit S [Prevotella fusca]|uniref:Restriction endonuclease subunit S n=1 Tax=Prevotella fusca JCM 17724 TaxID=1236517 RepID=A0A0K1NMI3_9BACT|nr:restriction endonuclease subunit S [Prevotella fusca]AKU70294.1 hypothetical protein ADJ77_10955 [Prevotella fusca JCM 17724]QUB85913.1 restriction endonuclease subunit S [Prevotella fusca JCM 17724]
MKKYDEYKDSGVAWIGEVPKHWEVRKIKQCCNKEQYSIKTGPFGSQLKGEELMSQGDVSVYSQQNVINNDFNKIRYFVSNKKAKSLSSFYTRANDVLITSRGTIGKAAILQPLYPKGILHPCLIAIRLDQEICLPEWLTMYINETDCFKTDISVSSNATTIDVIYTGTLKDIYIPIPTISEQTAIATYLDTHCAKIDNLISIQQKRIALLQELKQSVITHAVTKGLNPNVEMKQSGVEWIGDVPKHWEVMPLKKYCKMNKGLTFTKTDIVDEGESVISYGQIHSKLNNGVSLDCKLIRHVPIGIVKNGEKSKAHKGDFIFADTSEDYEGCGNFVYNDTNQAIYGGYHTIILQTETLNAKYIGYLFKTDCWRYQIRSRVYGVKVYSITQSILSICSIILPPQDEQKQIASYLDHKCATIDTSISNAQHQIDLLQEYKQSLITEVVTGKSKVTDN